MARRAVYSFHKTSTRPYVLKQMIAKGTSVTVVAEMKFDIPRSYQFHTEQSVDIAVDLIRVDVSSGK
jgi:rRNA N6-adenosine-methyltransferase METTL5